MDIYERFLNNLKEGVYVLPPLYRVIEEALHFYKEENVGIVFYNDNYNFEYTTNDGKLQLFEFLNIDEANVNDVNVINHFFFTELFKVSIIIKKDKVTITNSRRDTHIITGIYTKIEFLSDSTLHTIRFNRDSYTSAEWYASYVHSHLSSLNKSDITIWKTACFGSSELGTIALDSSTIYDELSCYNIFLNIDKFLEWESIEGVPYKYINSINKKRFYTKPKTNFRHSSDYNKCKELYYGIVNHADFYDSVTVVKTFDNDKNIHFYELVFDIPLFLKLFPDDEPLTDYKLGTDDSDNPVFYYYEDGTSDTKIPIEIPVLRFKGELMYLKHVKDTTIINDEPFTISPTLVYDMIEYITLKFNLHYAKSIFKK